MILDTGVDEPYRMFTTLRIRCCFESTTPTVDSCLWDIA
jgi:hypothetical protein